MKTPICDQLQSELVDKYANGTFEDALPLARRLELDRAALMEALETSEKISQAIKLGKPMFESHFNAMVDEFEAKRERALSAARANFPDA